MMEYAGGIASKRRTPTFPIEGTHVAVAAAAAAAVALGFAITRIDAGRDAVALAAIAAVLLAPIAFRVARRQFDPFEPIVVFAVAFGAMFVIRPAAMLIYGDFVYERSSRTIAIRETFSEMTLLAAAGAAAFVAGYALPVGRRIARRRHRPAPSFNAGRVVSGAVITAAAGIALTILFLIGAGESVALILAGRSERLTETYRSSSAYLSHGPYLLAPAALMLFAIGREQARNGLVVLAGVFSLFLLVLTVPIGSRMLLLPFVGGAVVYYYVSRNKRPGIVAVLTLLLMSLFASTLLLNGRAADDRSGSFRQAARSTLQQPERMLSPLTRGADAEMAAALAAVLKVVPEDVSFMRGGATIGDFFTRPVPRAFWSEKPLSPRETIISRLWPNEYRDRVANPEFSVLLYFYLDFALLGVIIGMAAYGVIARAIYERFRAHADNVLTRLLFALSVPFVVIALRDSPVDTFVRGVFILVPLLLVFRLAAQHPPRSREA